MAIATGVAIAAGVSAAAGAAKGIMGASQASKAKREMDNFQRQKLTNIAEGMRVSTLGAELQTQEAQRRFATSVDALRSGGVRGLVGGLGQQAQIQQAGQQQIAAGLDMQQAQIEQVRAQDEARIQGMIEQRQSFDYQMLAGQRAAGRQALMSGIGDVAGAVAFAGMNLDSMQGVDTKGTPTPPPPPTTPKDFDRLGFNANPLAGYASSLSTYQPSTLTPLYDRETKKPN